MLKGLGRLPGRSALKFDQEKYILGDTCSRLAYAKQQVAIFTIENQHFLVQMAPEASWPPDVSAESLEARRNSQPGVRSQASSARIPQSGVLSKIPRPGVLSQESPARKPQNCRPHFHYLNIAFSNTKSAFFGRIMGGTPRQP